MAFADRLAFARKQKKQSDLGKAIGTSGDIIGKYECWENVPSIDVVTKIADALGVTLDYLVKDEQYEQIDNSTLKKIKQYRNLTVALKLTYLQPSMLLSKLLNLKILWQCSSVSTKQNII